METEKYATDMKKSLFVIAAIILAFSCTKEQPNTNKQGQDVPASDFQALKKEVEELKTTVAALTSGNPDQIVSKSEFDALKQENEALKAKVEELSSLFFEVDGLRFDLNGEIISTPKKPSSQTTDENKYRFGMHTSTRTYDTVGRLIETYDEYSQIGLNYFTPPFYWQKVMYEYSGKTCKTTTQKKTQPVEGQYEEEITETTYW